MDSISQKQLRRLMYYKERLDITYKEISVRSGVPESTVKKIITGVTKKPHKKTVAEIEKALGISDVLRDEGAKDVYLRASASQEYVYGTEAEDTINYERGNYGDKTLADYYALPEDRRAELIDGVIYDMSSPSFVHQEIISEFVYQIKDYIHKNKGKCKVLPAPIDVQLDCDEKTMLQPDVVILCDDKKNKNRCIFGPPDFVCEVLSSSTKFRDSVLKLWKYMNAGVREYWMVDTDKKKVICYFFEQGEEAAEYSLEDDIPVMIYEGKLKISLRNIGPDNS